MKVPFSWLSNVLLILVVFSLGVVAQSRFALAEKLNLVESPPTAGDLSANTLDNLLNTDQPEDKSSVDFSTFWEVWRYLETDYLDSEKLDTKNMVDGAIAGMTAALGDPYTSYLTPKQKQRSGEDLAGAFYGVGIELGYVDGILAVVAPLSGTPADQAGVQAGDLILRVKDTAKELDESTNNWTLTEAVDAIRGPKDSPVTLTLFREDNGPEPFEVTINRGEIIVKSVEVEYVEHAGKRVAHIKLTRFGERTPAEWDEVVREIVAQGPAVQGVVLDMRNNPGGFFDDAIMIASDFVESGVVVSQEGKFVSEDYTVTSGNARLKNYPLTVLVNRGSASASEIVAGALRDRVQAKLVGEKTFGKGTVQDRRELRNGGALHVTIARWVLPGGDWIHEEGIPVQVEAKNDPETEQDEALFTAIESL